MSGERIATERLRVSFENPPIVESALGIQFDELHRLKTVHFGLYFSEIEKHFPVAEEQPRLEPIVERFPKSGKVAAIHFRTFPIPQRFVFKDSENGSQLIQVQADRFGFNWRKPENRDDVQYPRFDVNAAQCVAEYERFEQFCEQKDIGTLRPNLCEVVYVNHIWPADGEAVVGLFYDLFPSLSRSCTDWSQTEDAVAFNRVYVMGNQWGRLYVEASVARHKERGDFILLKITARALHQDRSTVLDTLGTAHDWLISAFMALTSERIRKDRWRQV